MTKIKLYCQGAAARVKVEGSITAGAVGIPVEIECDSAWDGLTKTLVCMSADRRVPIVLGKKTPILAWEVLIQGMHLYLGLEGRNSAGDIIIPTTWADCGRVQPSAEGSHTGLPTPTEMEQLLLLAAASGEDGRKALEICETLKTTLVSSEDVEIAVGKWLNSHASTVSGLSAVGAVRDQVPVAEGNGTWHWKDLPDPGETYDDTQLRQAITALETGKVGAEALQQVAAGKLDIQQNPMDSGKVITVNEYGVLVPGEYSGGALAENAVLYQEDDTDEDSQTVEALLLDKLTLESDGEYVYLLYGTTELGRAEAGSGGGGTAVYCTGVTVNGGDLSVDVNDGEEHYLTAAVTPAGCTQTLRWSSSNTKVATVNGDGKLTIVGQGSTTITAKCGSYSDSVTVSVIQKRRDVSIVLGGIELSGTSATHNTSRSDRASMQPMLLYVGDGAKVTVKCSNPAFYFGPTGFLVPGMTTDLSGPTVPTSGRISDPGWVQGEYTVTASGWTHMAVSFRYGTGAVFTGQALEELKNAFTIEVE